MSLFRNEARGVCDDGEIKEFAISFFRLMAPNVPSGRLGAGRLGWDMSRQS